MVYIATPVIPSCFVAFFSDPYSFFQIFNLFKASNPIFVVLGDCLIRMFCGYSTVCSIRVVEPVKHIYTIYCHHRPYSLFIEVVTLVTVAKDLSANVQ